MRSHEKAIWIEFRSPRTKEERSVYGLTESTNTTAKIFINTGLKHTRYSDTFFHEMAHVFFSFFNNRVPRNRQEKIAQRIGRIVSEILR